MRGETTPVVRGLKRTLAMLAAFSVLMAIMAVYAQPALAHHPILDGSAACNSDGDIEVTWSLSNGNWSGKSMTVDAVEYTDGEDVLEDIEVGLTLAADESVDDVVVYSGSESGTKTLRVRADWVYGSQDVWSELSIDLSQYDCEPEYQPVTIVVGHGSCDGSTRLGWAFFVIDPESGATVTLDGPGGPYVMSSDTNLELNPGPYTWSAEAADGYVLEGKAYGSFEIEPCEAEVVVSHGNCSTGEGVEPGYVTVEINPESGATVSVEGPGGPYDFETGGTLSLSAGSYSWNATPATGYAISGESSGYFEIEPCEASVIVSHGHCTVDDGVEPGYVKVSIDPEDAAIVVIEGPGGPYTFDGSGGTKALEAGEYSWEAEGVDDFQLEGDTSGEFLVEDCGEIIVEKEIVGDSDMKETFDLSVMLGDGVIWSGELGDGDSSGAIAVNAGTYLVSEALPDGWHLEDLECDDDDANRGDGAFMTIQVDPGESVTCTFSNEQDKEEVEVKDDVVEKPKNDEVDDVEVLPFTGPNTGQLMGISFALLAAGTSLVHYARRREEDER